MEAGGSPGHPQGSRQLVLDSDRRLPLLHLVVRKSSQILSHVLPEINLEGLRTGRLKPVGEHLVIRFGLNFRVKRIRLTSSWSSFWP